MTWLKICHSSQTPANHTKEQVPLHAPPATPRSCLFSCRLSHLGVVGGALEISHPVLIFVLLGGTKSAASSMSASVAPSTASTIRDLVSFSGRRCPPVPKRRATVYLNGSERGMLRRKFVSKGIAFSVFCSLLTSDPVQVAGMERLPFRPEGYNFWTWKGHKIHYVEQGKGRPVVLIHGFGASAFHWRYNIPELAKTHKVYAIDLLGFGWSEKALIEYDATIWRDQLSDFLKEIVKEPAVLVGNSLGGFAALITAAELPQQVYGVVLLNSAGQFASPSGQADNKKEETALEKFFVNPLKEVLQKIILGFLFWQSKQPARVEKVLKSVYINTSNVDSYLVESITRPTADPNAGEVYYRLMTRFMSNQSKYTLDSVLSKLSCPLLLLWGDLDPWVGPAKANRIKEFYPNTTIVNLQAGHCPHDEVPEQVNIALMDWLSSL